VTLLFREGIARSRPCRAPSECLSDGQRVCRRPKIGPDISRVIPYAHYRYRAEVFESFFNRLTLLQDETPPVTKIIIQAKASKHGLRGRIPKASRRSDVRSGGSFWACPVLCTTRTLKAGALQ